METEFIINKKVDKIKTEWCLKEMKRLMELASQELNYEALKDLFKLSGIKFFAYMITPGQYQEPQIKRYCVQVDKECIMLQDEDTKQSVYRQIKTYLNTI